MNPDNPTENDNLTETDKDPNTDSISSEKDLLNTDDLVEGVDYVLDDKGRKVHPETGKQLKGFALHKSRINRNGRPSGSRNKSTLLKAQLSMDKDAEYAAELWSALMRNDKVFLGLNECEDVPLTLRQKAAKDILDKSIANESSKSKDESASKEKPDNSPIFSPVPISKKSS